MATKGRGAYQHRTKPSFVVKLRELGYLVEQNQETTAMLLGVVLAQAEEIDALIARVKVVETRQPSGFSR
jgi:hypothetical protein